MSFNPRRMYYIKDNKLTIILELPYKPNEFKAKAEIKGDNNVFTFTGKIDKAKDDFSLISSGKFSLFLKIPTKIAILQKTALKGTKREKGKVELQYDIIDKKEREDEEEEKNNNDEEED